MASAGPTVTQLSFLCLFSPRHSSQEDTNACLASDPSGLLASIGHKKSQGQAKSQSAKRLGEMDRWTAGSTVGARRI
jgi:hypothetical protein